MFWEINFRDAIIKILSMTIFSSSQLKLENLYKKLYIRILQKNDDEILFFQYFEQSRKIENFTIILFLQVSADEESAKLPEFLSELDLASIEASEEDIKDLKKVVKRLAPEKNGEYQIYQGFHHFLIIFKIIF